MIRVYDFQCPDGHIHELFVKDTTGQACPTCGKAMSVKLSAPRVSLEGTTGDFPGAALRWERKREQKMAVERKKKADHGTYT